MQIGQKRIFSFRDTSVLLRFVVVGIVNTCVGVIIYWLLLYVGFSYQLASLFSLLLGIIFSFNSHRLVVFKAKGVFFMYIFVWLLIYFFNIEMISIIRVYMGDYFSAVALLPVNATLSFMLLKRFVFRSYKASIF